MCVWVLAGAGVGGRLGGRMGGFVGGRLVKVIVRWACESLFVIELRYVCGSGVFVGGHGGAWVGGVVDVGSKLI